MPVDPQKYLNAGGVHDARRRHRRRIVVKAEPQENGPAIANLDDTDTAGVYEAQLTPTTTRRKYCGAYNVDAGEGDLKTVDAASNWPAN